MTIIGYSIRYITHEDLHNKALNKYETGVILDKINMSYPKHSSKRSSNRSLNADFISRPSSEGNNMTSTEHYRDVVSSDLYLVKKDSGGSELVHPMRVEDIY